jgi:hypothetical protein
MHFNLLLSDINCQVYIYSVNLEVLRLHERWIGLSGRGQEGVFGANIVYFTCIVLQTYFSVGCQYVLALRRLTNCQAW